MKHFDHTALAEFDQWVEYKQFAEKLESPADHGFFNYEYQSTSDLNAPYNEKLKGQFQIRWQFDNGLRVSLIYKYCSYGFEDGLGEIWCSRIEDDPIGYLTEEEVIDRLNYYKNYEERR